MPLPNRIRRLVERRPRREDTQGQLFWLVDVILACSETGLTVEEAHLKKALGLLGRFLQHNDEATLTQARTELEVFEALLAERRKS